MEITIEQQRSLYMILFEKWAVLMERHRNRIPNLWGEPICLACLAWNKLGLIAIRKANAFLPVLNNYTCATTWPRNAVNVQLICSSNAGKKRWFHQLCFFVKSTTRKKKMPAETTIWLTILCLSAAFVSSYFQSSICIPDSPCFFCTHALF